MKNTILIAIILLTTFTSYCQTDTTRVEQYASVVTTPRLLSNKVTIDIDYGEEKSLWKDTRLKEENGKLRKFNTAIDALNFMGRDGWVLVNALSFINGSTQTYHYVFKKSFLKSEVAK